MAEWFYISTADEMSKCLNEMIYSRVTHDIMVARDSGARVSIKMPSHMDMNSHHKDETVF